jgi:hypothetical protein
MQNKHQHMVWCAISSTVGYSDTVSKKDHPACIQRASDFFSTLFASPLVQTCTAATSKTSRETMKMLSFDWIVALLLSTHMIPSESSRLHCTISKQNIPGHKDTSLRKAFQYEFEWHNMVSDSYIWFPLSRRQKTCIHSTHNHQRHIYDERSDEILLRLRHER